MAFKPNSHVEQVAEHLRTLLRQRHWTGLMPGALKLEKELGASHTIIDRALRQLEHEGLLQNQGPGRRRRITLRSDKPSQLNVRLLHYDVKNNPLVELLDRLHQAGHQATFTEKSLTDLGMDLKRIIKMVKETPADAWIVVAGSGEVLKWFSEQPTPAFAMYGRIKDIPIASASPRKIPTLQKLMDQLLKFGHRRFVNIVREERRTPNPSGVEKFFLSHLEANGILTGKYNLPDWGDTPQDLQRMLDAIFTHTPPTALLIDEPSILIAAKDHLASKGIIAPRDVSIACYDADPSFSWYLPPITHIDWDPTKLLQAVVRWVNQVGKGNNHQRLTLVDSTFVPGGTIGPAPM